jgi:diguanylate cyclase (GGDEF)-like protein
MVLHRFGMMLTELVRESDIPCRFGGEEFAVILPGATLEQAAAVMNRVRQQVANVRWSRHPERAVTASFGIASAGADGDWSVGTILASADRALYRAKAMGRNRVEIAEVAPLRQAG